MDYIPGLIPDDSKAIPRFLAEELRKLASVVNLGLVKEVEFLHVAPAKPREGDICGADGVDWNPGGGKGVYTYYSATWNKLG